MIRETSNNVKSVLDKKIKKIETYDLILQTIVEDIKKLKILYNSGKIDETTYFKYYNNLKKKANRILYNIQKDLHYVKELLLIEANINRFDYEIKSTSKIKVSRHINRKKNDLIIDTKHKIFTRNLDTSRITRPGTSKKRKTDKSVKYNNILKLLIKYKESLDNSKSKTHQKSKKFLYKNYLVDHKHKYKWDVKKYLLVIANRVFNKYVRFLFQKYPKLYLVLYKTVKMAGYRVTVKSFLSLVLFIYTILTIFLLGIIYMTIRNILISLILSFLISSLFIFTSLLIVPYLRKNNIEKEVSYYLPLVIIHASMLAKSGMDIKEIIRVISKENYGYISEEFSRILFYTEGLGIGIQTAIKRVATSTISEKLREFLEELSLAVSSTSNFKDFLSVAEESAIIEYKSNNDKFLQALKTFSDMYVGLVLTVPIILVSIVIMLSSLSQSIWKFSMISIVNFLVYLVVPAINILALSLMYKILPR